MDNENSRNALIQMLSKIRDHILESIFTEHFDYEGSMRTLLQHIEAAQQLKDAKLLAQTYYALGSIAMDRTGDYDNAENYILKAKSAFEAANLPTSVAAMLNNLGEIYRRRGMPDEAAQYFEQCRIVCHEAGVRSTEIYGYSNEGLLWTEFGDFSRAIALFRTAIDMAYQSFQTRSDVKELLAETYFGLASAYLGLRDIPQARRMAKKSLEYAEELALVDQLAMAHQILAQVVMVDPQPDEDSSALLATSEHYWRQFNGPRELGVFLLVKGDWLLQQNDEENALLVFEEALKLFESIGHQRQAEIARQRLQHIH